MTADCLDPQLMRRLVRRIGAYLEDGAVKEDSLNEVFGMFGADHAHRTAVRQALRSTGVAVIAPLDASAPTEFVPVGRPLTSALTSQPSSSDSAPALEAAEPPDPKPVRAQGPPVRTVEGPDHGWLSDSINAARLLLDEDRWNPKPWKRLLTASEEVGLAALMRQGGEPLNEALPVGFRLSLSHRDERARAFDALMLHNRGLVWSLVKRHMGEGLEPEDLEQSGYSGLRRAVEMFDASQGWKFSTYATHWINQSMSRAVANEGRLVRLPVHMYERVQKVRAIRERLLVELGRAPLFDMATMAGIRPDQVLECLRLNMGIVSLDAPVGEDGGTTLEALFENDRAALPDPASILLLVEGHAELLDAIDELPEREALIIRLRFGLDDGEPSTLDEIGQRLGVTRERVRQIESKAKVRLADLLHARGFGPAIWPPLVPEVD
ncbi:RNA polymerase sigma factor RpoD/SigA [Terracoccus sp. 273MFTsu3.1]|uniref:sigma-70 family RNA polymerase sigma factor n=1 Tax=Terracoccus sp. 273MFTsu3.1 TaxID=1172188 RepID=UPI00035F6688|nr:sigma-70 family RNA polymerase sigma factor [Terracoccus sp. 273MFTsu3.1]